MRGLFSFFWQIHIGFTPVRSCVVANISVNDCWFPVTRPTVILTPDPTNFFFMFPTKKKMQAREIIKTITFYQSIMTVTDIFYDIHLPVDKTSIVTARGSAIVSGLAVSKNKISK
jgi:hypothetical protein